MWRRTPQSSQDERHFPRIRGPRSPHSSVDRGLADPSAFDDPAAAERAQALVRYLAHSFRVVEMFLALPAVETPIAQVLDSVGDLLGL